jgi:uncharacterized coiled-coil protein SlyX
MIESDLLEDLQSRIAFLEKHVTEQDAEMYQLSKRIDSLVKAAKEEKAQLVGGYMVTDRMLAMFKKKVK